LSLPDLGERICLSIARQETVASDPAYWLWRAIQFDQARPRCGDYPGGPVDWETGRVQNPPNNGAILAEADRHCGKIRDACLTRAERPELVIAERLAGDRDG
jgi:hypothetical protein